MLQTLRDKTSGWIATIIILLLIIPVGFIGMSDYLVQRSDTDAARVSVPPAWWRGAPGWWPASRLWTTESITAQAFSDRFEQARQAARAEQGDAFDAREFESEENRRELLDLMIDETVLRMAAARDGLVVGDALVRDTIAGIPAFQVDGKFNAERYRLALATQGQTPAQFDQLVREGLRTGLLSGAVAESGFVTANELKRLVTVLGERREARMVMVPRPAPSTEPVTDAQAQAWFDANKARYRAPEEVTIEYVEVDGAALQVPALDEAALRGRYESMKSRYQSQEERAASHILVRVPAGADAATVAAAQRKAAGFAAQARAAGADFAAIARASSDDIGSRATGGDLGWIARGAMPAPFEQALYALSVGQVSEPVRTDAGWHVIQLRELKAGAQQTFEEVRDTLAREEQQSARERAFSELAGKLVDAVNRNPSSLAPAARAVGLPLRTLGPLTRQSRDGLAGNPAVLRAAFGEAAIEDRTASSLIEVGPDRSVVLRVTQHAPERPLTLAQARARVDADVRADRVRKAQQARVDALVKRLKAGEAFEAVARAEGLDAPQRVPGVQRGAPLPTPAVGDAVFAAPAPRAGAASAGHALLDDGRAVVFTVDAVQPGRLDALSQDERTQLAEQIASGRAGEEAQALARALRRQMRIEIVDANL